MLRIPEIRLLRPGQNMPIGIAVDGEPDHRQARAGDPKRQEHPAPAKRQHQGGQDQRRQRGADLVAGKTNADRPSPRLGGEPVAGEAHQTREQRRLGRAQCHAGQHELACPQDQTAAGLRHRPGEDRTRHHPARPKPVDQHTPRDLTQRIGPQKRRQQQTHARVRQSQIGADQGIGDRQRGTVNEIHHPRDRH